MDSTSNLEHAVAEVVATPTWGAIGRVIRELETVGAPTAESRDRALTMLERAARTLLSPADKLQDFVFANETFLLPRVLAMRSGPSSEHAYWDSKRRQMEGYLEHRLDDGTFGHVLTSLLICESIVEGRAKAFGALLRRLSGAGAKRFRKGLPASRDAFFNLLVSGGWLDGDLSPARAALADSVQGLGTMTGPQIRAWSFATMDLFFTAQAPESWLELLFQDVMLAVLARAALQPDKTLLEDTWRMEFLVSRDYLRRAEGIERFKLIMGPLSAAQRSCGASLKLMEGRAAQESAEVPQEYSRIRVGFIVHSGARLAHTDNLLTFLRGFAALDNPGLEPIVYVALMGIGESAEAISDTLAQLGVPLRLPPPNAGPPTVWLRHAMEADRVTAAIFISSPLFMGFSAGYRIAPVLMWWAMKYHGLTVDGVDGYLTVGNFFDDTREIDGRSWRSTRMVLPELRDPRVIDEAAAFRKQTGVDPEQILFACIGREEKMLEWRYIDSIGKILEQCPGSRFVWTGRSGLISQVQALLEKRGIADRCACAGWLPNTKVLAQALDVYLDTFPFASGHTGYEAMAAGKPIVVLTTPEALESSTATSLVPAIRGEIGRHEDQAAVRAIFTDPHGGSILPYVESVDDYVAWGIRLGRDTEFRRVVGAACQSFVERFARNERRCAATTVRHIREVVLGKVGGIGGSGGTANVSR